MASVPQGASLPGRFSWRKARWRSPCPTATAFADGTWLDLGPPALAEGGLGARNAEYLAALDGAWRAAVAPRAASAPTVASTFAGAGGSSLGYAMAGFREVLAVEWDASAAATFAANFPEVPVWRGDVRELSAEEFLERCGTGAGKLDVLDGSPPCQGFSTAGKREFFDPRNQLYNEFVRLVGGARPRAFVMENVSGMVKGKMKAAFADATRKLKAEGYRVRVKLLDAQWLGVPQSRKRLIWVGIREDLGVEPRHPASFGPPLSLADAIWDLLPGVAGQVSPFERKEFVAASRNELHGNKWKPSGWSTPTVTGSRPPVVRVEASGGGYMKGRGWDGGRPRGAALPTRPPTLAVRSGLRTRGGLGSDERDGGADSPSHSLGASPSDSSGGEYCRPLTVRECARVQSFPDRFWLPDGAKGYRQVGNSVPPLMMRAIALAVRAALAEADGHADEPGAG